MFNNLKQKWRVSGAQFWLIMATFAVTGSTTAWITRKITDWAVLEKYSAGWWTLKIIILVFGYQLLILFFGFIFGQFRFFWNYEKKILRKLGIMPPETPESIRIAVFASGKGSNFEKILSHFDNHPRIRVSLLVSNNKRAGALDIALLNRVESWVIAGEDLADGRQLARRLKKEKINYIILAGFLKKIPEGIIAAYPGRILNIHPALLPDFGGKGMYGSRVHEAVLSSGVKNSGITIHLVDEHYDNGDVIFQASCEIGQNETADSLAQKIHTLEHIHFPVEIEKFIEKQNHR